MSVFQNILKLLVGDFFAKTLNFLAFIYLARVLGVSTYGVLEFALSIMTYCLLVADGGLELWATRAVAQSTDVRFLVVRVLPLRMILATGVFGTLMLLLPVFPDYPNLETIFIFFGLTVFVQALNLKWVFMGQGKMTKVSIGLVVGQIIFFGTLLIWVESPSGILWVPIFRLGSDWIMICYFGYIYSKTFKGLPRSFTLKGTSEMLRPVITMGASHGLATISYNFDFVLIGFLLGASQVGLYSAGYKPITMVLGLPVSYFLGLFPILSQAFIQGQETFNAIVNRSLGLTSIVALPIGFLGIFLADHIILLLFGEAYSGAVPVLQVLTWSATLVILRGTFRQALNAAGKAHLDLRCAAFSTVVNISLNFLLIPRYGIIGAAHATVISEVVWVFMSASYLNKNVVPINLLSVISRPFIASVAMASCFLILPHLLWVIQAALASIVYFLALLLLGDSEVRSWVRIRSLDRE